MNISWIREHRFIHPWACGRGAGRHPVLEAIKPAPADGPGFDFADSGKVLEELESL